MKKLLLIGGSGFLGWNTSYFPQTEWQIIGTYHKHPDGMYPKIPSVTLDLLDANKVTQTIDQIRPDAILHLAANSSTGFCEKHPEAARKINVEASAILAENCAQKNIPFLFTSSEQVYDGSKAIYSDAEKPCPINAYGQQKAEAEEVIQQLCPDACIARIAVLFGQQGPTSYCFMNDWLAKWKAGEAVTAFHDEVRSFLSGQSAAEALFLLLNKQVKGIYNIGGGDAMSRYEFATLLADTFGYENAKITSLSQQDVPGGDKRPASLILDNVKMKGLGFQPKKIKKELEKLI